MGLVYALQGAFKARRADADCAIFAQSDTFFLAVLDAWWLTNHRLGGGCYVGANCVRPRLVRMQGIWHEKPFEYYDNAWANTALCKPRANAVRPYAPVA